MLTRNLHGVHMQLCIHMHKLYLLPTHTHTHAHALHTAVTGVIQVNATLDRETIPQYELIVMVQDQGNPPLNTTGIVRIVLLDENDNAPIFQNTSYSLTVPEGSYDNATILLVASATDVDSGSNGLVFHSIVSVLANGVTIESSPFAVETQSGAVVVSGQLDREGVASYSIQLAATDGGTPPRETQALVSYLRVHQSLYY